MMKVLLLVSCLSTVAAFEVSRPPQQSNPSLTMQHLVSPERVKQAGGGIPVVPPGDRQLFDPEIEGKLGGTGVLMDRINQAYQYLSDSAATVPETLDDAQNWLEDMQLPVNTYKPAAPGQAVVLGRSKLITDDAPGDIQHVVMQLPEDMQYVEGQSISVIPPGVNAKGKKHKPRLYSIASTRYGDLLDGKTVSLCVRRAEFVDKNGKVDPSKKGVCSNFLCDVKPGDVVKVAGPIGKTMLLPEEADKDIIMVATGTGIAPFRAFLQRLFVENTVARHMFSAKAWLILGVPVTGGLLYPGALEYMMQQESAGELEVTYAISREMKNAAGGKLYVQDVLTERADELFDKLDKGAVIYFCGLRGMMPGILEALERVATDRGMDWSQRLKELQANGQWHVEVY